ncbi:Leucine Rich repeats (2 copies) [Gemmata sp. SH-PL17]|uniref:TIGR02996 domain-containing protein n=1 Tax=Gemmata sp. SH-PL17 TaxID=1630693 RepID=UPI00078C1DE5|nr:TIGR02996 domain-containing protein [Gemmata sp. SH-PL17]AMV23085.1 Leucine Rich repeats (2 copies) [Gemmata sp. SH-PL17]
MSSDRDALLAAIRANSEDDTPRLVFADWLDENGDAARAEFIRSQCEFARVVAEDGNSYAMYAFLRDRYSVGLTATDWPRIDSGVHRLATLAKRSEELLRQHENRWVPKVPKKYEVEIDEFDRGFPRRVQLNSLQNLPKVVDWIRATLPAVTLKADRLTGRVVEQLADTGLLDRIDSLELTNESASGLREFGNRPEAARVRTIKVQGGDAEEIASALADSPHFTGLQTLDISAPHISATAAETLFRAKSLRTLRRLHLCGSESWRGNWTVDTARTLAAGEFTNLASVRFEHAGLGDDAVEILAACPDFARLRTFDLTGNHITGRGVTNLLCSPHLASLVNLCLDENPCNGLDPERLAAAPPAALRMLHFHGSRLRTADVRALARSPRVRTLWYLDIDDNNLSTTSVRALVRGLGTWCPPVLWLAYNRIDDSGAKVLAKWKAASALSALHLKYNPPMTEAGVRTLLDSPNLANLSALCVSASGEAEARLRERFKHPDGY